MKHLKPYIKYTVWCVPSYVYGSCTVSLREDTQCRSVRPVCITFTCLKRCLKICSHIYYVCLIITFSLFFFVTRSSLTLHALPVRFFLSSFFHFFLSFFPFFLSFLLSSFFPFFISFFFPFFFPVFRSFSYPDPIQFPGRSIIAVLCTFGPRDSIRQ